MNDEFLEDYILDSKEHILALNKALLNLEKDPQDKDSINRIFRAAHTLKGNSATMGFLDITNLAHATENIFEGVREGKLVITESIIDTLFETLDSIESMVESASTGGSSKASSKILKKLNSMNSGIEEESTKSEEKSFEKKDEEKVIDDSNAFKIKVSLTKNTPLKSVRAFMVIKSLDTLGQIISSEPDLKSIEQGKFESDFTLSIRTKVSSKDIESAVKRVANVEKYLVSEEKNKELEKPKRSVTKEIQTIRVPTDKLDSLVNLVGEMIISNSSLARVSKSLDNESLSHSLGALNRLSTELQELALSMRMVKVAQVFDKFPRTIRDLARKEGKDVEILIEGKDIELDRTVLDRLGDPLVHIIRNAVDHGIEEPDERERKGKDRKGTVRLSARREKDHVAIEISDDGKGINTQVLRDVAVRKGILTHKEVDDLSEDEAMALIFRPGFSGAKEVTDVSGRGVGMDVVKTSISKLGGSVKITSSEGKGTTFNLLLPLSLAIIKALLITANNEFYAIPSKDVLEVLSLKKSAIKKIKGREAVIYRGDPLPILRLGEILSTHNGDSCDESELIVVETMSRKFGIGVESILSQEEVVVKPLGMGISDIQGISGGTILGDGRVALILDIHNL
jgi:two-component system chemotaxis sensor kinase CheA